MNENKSSRAEFEEHYRVLNIAENDDWTKARNQYRTLVHRWHPDKFTDKPQEIENAQKQFIALSKSYNKLKEFHSLHNRLPLEGIQPEESRPDATLNTQPSMRSNVDPNNLDLGTLSRDEKKIDARLVKKKPFKKFLWLSVASVVVVSTIMLFFILDQKANQENIARGRQVVKEAPKSEFTPTASEIRRSVSKGAFIRN